MNKRDYILENLSIPQYFDLVILPNMSDYYSDITVDFELRPVTRCPLHSESTGSFRYNEDGEFFYCFGCGCGGNVIKLHQLFMEKEHGVTLTWDESVDEMYKLATNRGTKIIKNPFSMQEEELNNSVAILKFNVFLNKYIKYLRDNPMDYALMCYLISELDSYRSGVLGQGIPVNEGITKLKSTFNQVIQLRKTYTDSECLQQLLTN